MRTPPCYPDGHDCPRRYVGCRADCTPYHEWLAEHEAVREKRRQEKVSESDINAFERDKHRRIVRKANIDYQRRKRGEL